jgi:hypothetical protein
MRDGTCNRLAFCEHDIVDFVGNVIDDVVPYVFLRGAVERCTGEALDVHVHTYVLVDERGQIQWHVNSVRPEVLVQTHLSDLAALA